MRDTMTDNVLLGMDDPDGGVGNDDLLDGDTHSFTGDDDLETPGNLKSIFDDPPLEDNSPPISPLRRLSGGSLSDLNLMRNDIEEVEWRDDARDLPHRKEILLQVANLLLARKRNPTKEWLKELPYKTRKLEEQLYKGAPTLQDYLDKASLKYRLKRVAKNIVTQYRQARARRASSLEGMSPPKSSSHALLLAMEDTTPRQSNIKSRAHHVGSFQFHDPRSSMRSMRSSSSPNAAQLAAFSMMNGDQGRRRSPIGAVNLDASAFSQDPQSMNCMGLTSTGLMMSQQTATSLEERQMANQKLQQQILENIRQQQQLMRELMVQTNKNKLSRGMDMNGMHPQAQMFNIANPSTNNTSVHALAQSILLQGNKLPNRNSLNMMSNQQRQLPLDLLQQSLAMGGGEVNNMMQQQQRILTHPGMPPPSTRQSLNGGMYDDNTGNVNQAPNLYPW